MRRRSGRPAISPAPRPPRGGCAPPRPTTRAACTCSRRCSKRAEDFEGAERSLRDLLQRDPGDATALNYLGYMLAERGQRLDEAVDLVQRALKLEPGNPSFLDSLGWAYFQQGKLDLADPPLTEAASKMPNNSVIQDHLGDLRFKQQRFADAAAAWERSLAGDGDSIDRPRIQKKIQDARSRLEPPIARCRAARRQRGCSRSRACASLARARRRVRRSASSLPERTRRRPFPDAAHGATSRRSRSAAASARSRATLGLSGARDRRALRGNVDAGFEAPEKVRLEGRHPLGRPVFILVVAGPAGHALLPRENRVLRNAAPPTSSRRSSGCSSTPRRSARAGQRLRVRGRRAVRRTAVPAAWSAVDGRRRDDLPAAGARAVAGRCGATRRAGRRVHLLGLRERPAVDAAAAGRPARRRPTSPCGCRDVNINVPLEPEVFEVDVPARRRAADARRAAPRGAARRRNEPQTPTRDSAPPAPRCSAGSQRRIVGARARQGQSRSARARHPRRRLPRAAHRVSDHRAARHADRAGEAGAVRAEVPDARRAARRREPGLACGAALWKALGRAGDPADTVVTIEKAIPMRGRARRRQRRRGGGAAGAGAAVGRRAALAAARGRVRHRRRRAVLPVRRHRARAGPRRRDLSARRSSRVTGSSSSGRRSACRPPRPTPGTTRTGPPACASRAGAADPAGAVAEPRGADDQRSRAAGHPPASRRSAPSRPRCARPGRSPRRCRAAARPFSACSAPARPPRGRSGRSHERAPSAVLSRTLSRAEHEQRGPARSCAAFDPGRAIPATLIAF